MQRRLTFSVIAVLLIGTIIWFALGFHSSFGRVTLAYIANAANNHIQVVDLDSGKTLRKIYAGISPWRLLRSPDDKQLWAQHWYSESTAVINLDDHEISKVLPYRGPGIFTNKGEQFVTFNWPRSGMYRIDSKDGKNAGVKVTEISKVYDFAQRQDGSGFYLARFDPLSKAYKERFSYVVSYPFDISKPQSSAASKSLRTGLSPMRVIASKEPFILTADSESKGLSIINKLDDRRNIPTCPAPQAVVLSPDETHMAVLCWRGQGIRESYVVVYQTDFSVRPWPSIKETKTITIAGGVVAGRFSPDGDRLYVVDQSNRQLLELDAGTLDVLKTINTGDMPMDIELVEVTPNARDHLKNQESRARQAVKKILTQMKNLSAPYSDMSWQETGTWQKSVNVDAKDKDKPGLVTAKRTQYFKSPDWFRGETESGMVHLAQGGTNISIKPDGRFWVTPRQSLASMLYGIANLSVDEAIRYLAGDVPGSPYLRSGIAVDVSMQLSQQGDYQLEAGDHDHDHAHDNKHEAESRAQKESDHTHRYFVIGANQEGQHVTQLWVDMDTGYPTNLVEKYPVNKKEGHDNQDGKFGGIIETKFYDFKKIQDKYTMPSRLERVFDNGVVEKIQIDNITVNTGIPEQKFDLLRLGNTERVPELSPELSKVQPGKADKKPGMLIPSIGLDPIVNPFDPHAPYNSNPPTSGAYLPFIADWGISSMPLPLELQAHNLVDGGVVIQYNCPEACPETIAKLERIAKRYPEYVLLAPYPLMQSKISLTAWQRLDLLDEVDESRIVEFIEAYKGINHHTG